MRELIKVALLVVAWAVGGVLVAWAQTAQDNIERTIGALVVQNAQCGGQTMTLSQELQKIRAELAELKAKFPDGAKPEASPVPP